jgi:ABC-type lipoprotein release transport system permease subunit
MACAVNGVRFDEELQDTLYTSIVSFTIPTNGFELNEEYVPITNYDHEIRENEKKRRIKIISPRLVEQLIREYREIMG